MLSQFVLTVLQSSGGGGAMIFLLMFVLAIVVGLIIWTGLAYWTYKDANKRGMDNAGLWAVIVFLLGIIGIVIYLIVRE